MKRIQCLRYATPLREAGSLPAIVEEWPAYVRYLLARVLHADAFVQEAVRAHEAIV